MMKLPNPQKLAELLHKSLLPKSAKEIIVKQLPLLKDEQIVQIYETLQEEQSKIQQARTQLDSKLNIVEMQFSQELEAVAA